MSFLGPLQPFFNPAIGWFGVGLIEWGILETMNNFNFEGPKKARHNYIVGLTTDISS